MNTNDVVDTRNGRMKHDSTICGSELI